MIKPSSLRSWVGGKLQGWRARAAQRACLQRDLGLPSEIKPGDWISSVENPTAFYERCFQFFHGSLPEPLRDHRRYFTQNRRGFGEDAFHVMWFLLFQSLKPALILEIGVYRGQTISLFALLGHLQQRPVEVHGISPFSSAGDGVSKYLTGVDFLADTLRNFEHFSLPKPNLLKAFSTEPAACERIRSRPWDLIYIDGNHDYDVVKIDWENCSGQIRPGGVIILDDAGLTTRFEAPVFATRGHPGPSRVASEIDPARFREILQVGHNRVFQRIASA